MFALSDLQVSELKEAIISEVFRALIDLGFAKVDVFNAYAQITGTANTIQVRPWSAVTYCHFLSEEKVLTSLILSA